MNKRQWGYLVGMILSVAMLPGCTNFLKEPVIGGDGKPLSSYAMLVTSPNVIALASGKATTVNVTLDGTLFGGINYNTVTVRSSDPNVATVTLNKSTSPYSISLTSHNPGKTYITFRFDNNPDTDMTFEATVYAISNVGSLSAKSKDASAELTWEVPSNNRATHIEIYRNTVPTFSAQNRIDGGKVSLDTTKFVDSPLDNGTKYYYKVVLADADGFASSGITVSVTPTTTNGDTSGGTVPSNNPLSSIPDNTSNTPSSNTTPSGNSTPSGNGTSPSANPAPTAVQITGLTQVNNAQVNVSWSTPVDTDLTEIKVYIDGQIAATLKPTDFVAGGYTYTSGNLAPGLHTFNIGLSDGINPDVLSPTRSITVQAAGVNQPVEVVNPPHAPDIVSVTVIDHNKLKVDWTQNAADTHISTINVVVDNVIVATFTPADFTNGVLNYTTTTLSDGLHTVNISVTDGINTVNSAFAAARIDDRPAINTFTASLPTNNTPAFNQTIDGITYSNILPNKAILSWAVAGSSAGVQSVRVYDNNTLIHTFAATSTGYVTDALAPGDHVLTIEASDAAGKVSNRATQNVTVSYVQPVSNLSFDKSWAGINDGFLINLRWTLPETQLPGSQIEIRKSVGTPNPANPAGALNPGTEVITTTGMPSNYLGHLFTDITQPTYFDVRVKVNGVYSAAKQEIVVYPSNWSNSSAATKQVWNNQSQIVGTSITNYVRINCAVDPAYIDAENRSSRIEATMAGGTPVNPSNQLIEFEVYSGSIGDPDFIVALLPPHDWIQVSPGSAIISDPGVPDVWGPFLDTEKGKPVIQGAAVMRDIDLGMVMRFGTRVNGQSTVQETHAYKFNLCRTTDPINTGIVDGISFTDSTYTIKFNHGLAEIAEGNAAPIVGVVHFENKLQGYIQVLDDNGNVVSLYPFNLYRVLDPTNNKYRMNVFINSSQARSTGYRILI